MIIGFFLPTFYSLFFPIVCKKNIYFLLKEYNKNGFHRF